MSAADETAAQIVSVSFRSGKQLTSQTLIKVLQKVIEIEKAARAADKEAMTDDPTGGKVPYKKLMKLKQPLAYALDKEGNPIDIPRADMDLFNRAAKKYGLKYSLVKEVITEQNGNRSTVFTFSYMKRDADRLSAMLGGFQRMQNERAKNPNYKKSLAGRLKEAMKKVLVQEPKDRSHSRGDREL